MTLDTMGPGGDSLHSIINLNSWSSPNYREPLVVSLHPDRVVNFQKSLNPVSLVQYCWSRFPPSKFPTVDKCGVFFSAPRYLLMQKSLVPTVSTLLASATTHILSQL